MKNYINLFAWGVMVYILIEVSIEHLKPQWIIPGVVVLILNVWYFTYKKEG